MSTVSNFSDKDRQQEHEAIRQLQDIRRRHHRDLSGADNAAFSEAIRAILHLEKCLGGHRPPPDEVTVTQAWYMGETAQLESVPLADNPFPPDDTRNRAWNYGWRQIPFRNAS